MRCLDEADVDKKYREGWQNEAEETESLLRKKVQLGGRGQDYKV